MNFGKDEGGRTKDEAEASVRHGVVPRDPASSFRLHPSSFPRHRRGTVLIVSMWGVLVMAAVVLLTARSVQVDAQAAGNRQSAVKASAIARGAEQYVLSLVENAGGDASAVTGANAEAMAVGDGYFWIIRPELADDPTTIPGLVDETSKLNINTATRDELMRLPGMTEVFADSIIDWRDADDNATGQGAEKDYYQRLPQGYDAKNGPFESIEELRLVKGVEVEPGDRGETMLYGYDHNHDGVLDDVERQEGGPASKLNSAQGAGRGIAPFITVYSVEANQTQGKTDVNSNDANQVIQALQSVIPQQRAQAIVALARAGPAPQGNALRFANVFDFCFKGQMTAAEVKLAFPKLRAGQGRLNTGRININTAPREVLLCLEGLTEGDVDKITSTRDTQAGTGIAWVYEALGGQKAAAIGGRLTDKAYQYSADIVAITGDARTFRRIRVVVDGRQTPAKIVYRKDVTDLGWPLDEGIRETLRAGGRLDGLFD